MGGGFCAVVPAVRVRAVRHRLPDRGGKDLQRRPQAELHRPLQAQRHLQGARGKRNLLLQPVRLPGEGCSLICIFYIGEAG